MTGHDSTGQITSGIPADAAALKTLDFIERHLPAWRDDPERPIAERERDLNSQLCKFLNVAARRSEFAMVHFHHEEPQGMRHAADFSANPADGGWIVGSPHTKYDPILVIEGKRLPTPGSNRDREYVASVTGKAPAGAIQRFKLGLHGSAVSIAGIIGYVQQKSCKDWIATINQWIDELASSGDPIWSAADRLKRFTFDLTARKSRSESEHSRESGSSPTICLIHLWVEM